MFNPLTQIYHFLLGSASSSQQIDNLNNSANSIGNIPSAITGFFGTLKLWLQIGVALIVGIAVYKIAKTLKIKF